MDGTLLKGSLGVKGRVVETGSLLCPQAGYLGLRASDAAQDDTTSGRKFTGEATLLERERYSAAD